MNRDEVLKKIEKAIEMTDSYLAFTPKDKRLTLVRKELHGIHAIVKAQWPLPIEVKQKIWLGLYAVREFENYLDDYAAFLEELSYDLKHS